MPHRTLLAIALVAAVVPAVRPADPAPVPVRITRDGSFKQHLQWSPDGKQLLFTRIHQGKMALWTINADGSGVKRDRKSTRLNSSHLH